MRNSKRYAVCTAGMLILSAVMSSMAMGAQKAYSIDMTDNNNEAWEKVAMTNDDTVRTGACVRVSANSDAEIVGFLYRGAGVTVLDKGEEWTQIKSGKVEGYVKNEYLTYGTEAKGLAEHYGDYGVEASWDDVNIFAWDDKNAKIIGQADDGDTYKIVNNNGHWIEVDTGDKNTAYVSEEDVDMVIMVDTAVAINDENDGSSYAPATYQEASYEEPSYEETASYDNTASAQAAADAQAAQTADQYYSTETPATEPAAETTAVVADASLSYDEGATADYTEDYSDDASADYTEDYSEDTSADYTEDYSEDYSEDYTADEAEVVSDQDGVVEDGAVEEDYTDDSYEEDDYTTEEEYVEDGSDDYSDDGYTEDAYDDSYEEDSYEYEEETSAPETEAASASSSDTDLLAAIIWCEAGNQPFDGMVAVGAVVMNRVASGSFPNTISEVIYQSGQFTPAYSGTLAGALASGVPGSCYEAANAALSGQDPTGGCLYFNTSHGSGVKIGAHWFY